MQLTLEPILTPDHSRLINIAGDTSSTEMETSHRRRETACQRVHYEITWIREIPDKIGDFLNRLLPIVGVFFL
jgi:hypothetical protein